MIVFVFFFIIRIEHFNPSSKLRPTAPESSPTYRTPSLRKALVKLIFSPESCWMVVVAVLIGPKWIATNRLVVFLVVLGCNLMSCCGLKTVFCSVGMSVVKSETADVTASVGANVALLLSDSVDVAFFAVLLLSSTPSSPLSSSAPLSLSLSSLSLLLSLSSLSLSSSSPSPGSVLSSSLSSSLSPLPSSVAESGGAPPSVLSWRGGS